MFHRSILRALLTLLFIAAAFRLSAATPNKPKPPPLPTIADFNKAMAAEQYADAQKIAGILLQIGSAEDRAAVSFAYGRILLGQGAKKEFPVYRKAMRKLKLKGIDATLMDVWDAWAKAVTTPAEAEARDPDPGRDRPQARTLRGHGPGCRRAGRPVSCPRRLPQRQAGGRQRPEGLRRLSAHEDRLHREAPAQPVQGPRQRGPEAL